MHGERGYTLEAAIPWKAMGKKKPPLNQRMAATLEITDRRGDKIITERIPDARHDESWTWLEFRLAK